MSLLVSSKSRPSSTSTDLSLSRIARQLDSKRLPTHVAIIMDGNGRWAKKRHLPRVFGHKAGINTVREIVQYAGQLSIEHLTLFTFSSENWTRPTTEVRALMKLLERYLLKELPMLQQNRVRVNAIGRLDQLPKKALSALQKVITATETNTGLRLTLALNYGGRQEILDAFEKAMSVGVRRLDEKTFRKFLYQPELPDADLVIRTSGEKRLSNFLLWQSAYAEWHITDVQWPDFRPRHFLEALIDFQQRERRFGGVR